MTSDLQKNHGAAIAKPVAAYDENYRLTEADRKALPDVQNGAASAIEGANVPILQVGIAGFKLPLVHLTGHQEKVSLETTVTGTVSLSADAKGINMSRIMRVFYEFEDRVFSLELLDEILLRYKETLGSSRARLKLDFNYPIRKESLRSGLSGWQYYKVAFEGFVDDLNRYRRLIHFDFVYSSACPCSSDLAEHARQSRNVYSIPHSQRSKARITLEVKPGEHISIEDVQQHCLRALHTETQVMVKREDEQAFAEMNGAYVKFVEDAARLLYEQFDTDPRVRDFQIALSHLESLHSHDAVASINKGRPNGFDASFEDFSSLVC